MENKTLHIVIKSIVMLLLVAIVLPSVIKFVHVFEDHKHEVCTNTSDTHFHEVEIDCEFYKFKLNTAFSFILRPSKIIFHELNYKITTSQYQFVSDFQRLPFSLRGPPHLI
ncbi:hypothetical protein [Lacinutrix jangbogonensis]|uniref:hypothetical protein n=1 Tax=Lacinutrix jangbogonensis TaxID=1469557 RepID=UPI001F154AF8|nr:hypothetical protein [Lacinutrix jangbogonensis]